MQRTVKLLWYPATWRGDPRRGRNYVNYECCLTACQLHPITGNCHDPMALPVWYIRVQRAIHIERRLWKRTCAELQTGGINSRSVIHAATNMTGSGTTRFLQGGHICMNLNFYGNDNREQFNLDLCYHAVFYIDWRKFPRYFVWATSKHRGCYRRQWSQDASVF